MSGRTYEASLPERPVMVGTGEGCDLQLDCAGMGARQCRIEPLDDGRHVVRDLQSGHATRVNGIEIQQVSLSPGDLIEVGEAKILYATHATVQSIDEAPAVSAPASPRASRGPGRGQGAGGRAASSAPAAHARKAGGHSIKGPLIGLAVAAVVAFALALVLGGSGERSLAADAERRLEIALDLYRAQDYVGAGAELRAIAEDPSAGRVAEKAERYLARAETAIREADAALERLWAQRLDVDVDAVDVRRQLFIQKHGDAFAPRFDETIGRVREAQGAWAQDALAKVEKSADSLVESEAFADARAAWTSLRTQSTVGIRFDDEIREALDSIDERADAVAVTLLETVRETAQARGPQAALRRLRGRAPSFEGTAAQARIQAAIAGYESAVRTLAAAGRLPPEPTPEGGPEAPATPPTTDEPGADRGAAFLAAVARAEEAAKGRDFASAAATLGEALALDPPSAAAKRKAAGRLRDVELARDGLDRLIADIGARPERYRKIEMGTRFHVSLLAADRETVRAAVRGGETKYRWAGLAANRLATIADRMGAQGDDALALASLLRELGSEEMVEEHLVAAGAGGVASGRLFPVIARWRGETPPADGYVVHGARYVTPQEKARLELLARIDDATRRVHHRDAAVWKAASDELLSLGRPAREPLIRALRSRRSSTIEEIAGLKTFSSPRTKAKLYAELKKRRAHALALISDAGAWPYPNPSGRNTEEVVRRVDAVTEVWERPFDLIVQWDKKAKEHLTLVAEVDEVLTRADPDFKPDIDELRARVNQKIDMRTYTPDSSASSLRQYSLKVLAYNEKLDSTATREEQNCVRAVNEYRMMMGRWAVKINECLVRAARGHSRHMKENGYFAHNVPSNKGATKTNRTPGQRARAQGYGGGVGENIASGTWSGRDAFTAWFHSSGHHRNMIAKGWTEMGAGRSGGTWWTQLFGAMRGKSLSEPDALSAPEPAYAPEPEDDSGRPVAPAVPRVPDEEPPPGSPPPGEDESEEGASAE